MEFGIHAFVWTGGQTQGELEYAMAKAAEASFGVFEFPGLDARHFDIDRLGKIASEFGLKVAASAGLSPAHDVTSSDPEDVTRGETFLLDAISVARDLGSTQMSGPLYSAHQKFLHLPTEEGKQRSSSILNRVAEKAKEAGITLCIEVLNRYETNIINTVSQGLDYIRTTGSDNIFLHLDTYHMNIEELDMARAIHLAGDKIGYFHVGESHRGYLGTGMINFAPVFDALLDIHYDGFVSVEAFNMETNHEALKIACAIWRENWKDSDAFAYHSKAFLDLQLCEALRRHDAYHQVGTLTY